MIYRRVNIDNLAKLVIIGAETWRQTFSEMGYYTKEIVEGYIEEAFAKDVLAGELADDNNQFFILENHDVEPIGYIKTKFGTPSFATTKKLLQLQRFYLLPIAQGHGQGREAFDYTCEFAKELDCEGLWLTVWDFNLPAIGFYEKMGCRQHGSCQFTFISHGKTYRDTDLVMAKYW